MLLTSLLSVGCFVGILKGTASSLVGNENEVRNLVVRLLGDEERRFILKIVESAGNSQEEEKVQISRRTPQDPVTILGSTASIVTYGFNHYLKTHLKCQVSWDGDQLSLPPFNKMPIVDYQLTMMDEYRYYMNVCTFSYSYVWWNWTRWERELDWMALNGFNLALAFTGMESIWKQVYLELGLTESEIDDHFTGPAFLAWNRMGNMRGGDKLSDSWHSNQVALQKLILKRMRSLGIRPVLPAFAGHLPRAMTRLYPNTTFTLASRWNDLPDKYCCPAMLEPTEPLFQVIGSAFTKKLIETFGTDHFYNCDPFNEMKPTTTDLNDLKAYGKSIYSSITKIDPSAIWILQGWFIGNDPVYWQKDRVKAVLTSVPIIEIGHIGIELPGELAVAEALAIVSPSSGLFLLQSPNISLLTQQIPGSIIVLDLQAEIHPQYEKMDSFFGQPFIWCMLHNFGGTLGLEGTFERVRQGSIAARQSSGSTMVGLGLTMEGIGTNYAIYDFFADLEAQQSPDPPRFRLTTWIHDYAERRYGDINYNIDAGWNLLARTVYAYDGNKSLHGQYIFNTRPDLMEQPETWYDPHLVYEALQHFIRGAASIYTNDLFTMDLVDLTRQGLQLRLDETYVSIMEAYHNASLPKMKKEMAEFLDILADMDTILATDKHFLLGTWLRDARALGSTPLEKSAFEREARLQITSWAPVENLALLDYASKQWSGVVRSYIKPRWELFFIYLTNSVENKTKFDSEGFASHVYDIERHFVNSKENFSATTTGNPYIVALDLFVKWYGP